MRQREQLQELEESESNAEFSFPRVMKSRSPSSVDRSFPPGSEETGNGAQDSSHRFACAGTQLPIQANNCNTSNGDDVGRKENDTPLSSTSDATGEKTYRFLMINTGFVAQDQEGTCRTPADSSWDAETTYDFLSKRKAWAVPDECYVSGGPNPIRKSSDDHISFKTVTQEYQAGTSDRAPESHWPEDAPGNENSNYDTGEDHRHEGPDPGQESDDPSTYYGQEFEGEYKYECPAQYQRAGYQLFQGSNQHVHHEEGYPREEEISPNCCGSNAYGQQEFEGERPTQVSNAAAVDGEVYRGQDEGTAARILHDGMHTQDYRGQIPTEDSDTEYEEQAAPFTPFHEEVFKGQNGEGCESRDEIEPHGQSDVSYCQEYEGEVTAQEIQSDADKYQRDLAIAAHLYNSQSLGGTELEENCATSIPQSSTGTMNCTMVNQGGVFAPQSSNVLHAAGDPDSSIPYVLYPAGTPTSTSTESPMFPAGTADGCPNSVDGHGFGHVYPFFSQVPGTHPEVHTKTVTAGLDPATATQPEEYSQKPSRPDSEGFPHHDALRIQTGTQIRDLPVDSTPQAQLQVTSHSGGEDMEPSDRFIALQGTEWSHRTMGDSRGPNLAQEEDVELYMQCYSSAAPPASALHNQIHPLGPFLKNNSNGLQLNFQNQASANAEADHETDIVDGNQGMRPAENHGGQCGGQDNCNGSAREGEGSDVNLQWDAAAHSGEINQRQFPSEGHVHEDASQGSHLQCEEFPDPEGEEVPERDADNGEFENAHPEDEDSDSEDDDEEESDVEEDKTIDFDYENACDSLYPPYVTAEMLAEYGMQEFPMTVSEDDELAELEEFFCEALTFSRPEGDDREPEHAEPVESDGISLSDSFESESFEQNINIGSQDFLSRLHLNASNTLEERKKMFEGYINEIDQWYIEYCSALESVNYEFDAAVTYPFSRSYTQYPMYEFSRRLRRYRDAFAEHLIAVKRALGEEARVPSFSVKLRARKAAAEQQAHEERMAHEVSHLHHSAWRPQRGLPDKAVTVLKSWLFGNFLHPYPKDSDKDQLAKATGLTRGQVSNWFINARVRVWKPMIEDMYRLEHPEDTDPVSIAGDDEEEEFPNEDRTTASPLPDDDGGRSNKRPCLNSSAYAYHDQNNNSEEVPPQLPDEAAAIIALLPQPPNVRPQQLPDPTLASSTAEGDFETQQPQQAYEVPNGSMRTGRHQASRAFAPYSREMLAQFLRNAAITRYLGTNLQDQAPIDPRFIGHRFNDSQVSLELELCSDRDIGVTVLEAFPPAMAAGRELNDVNHHPQDVSIEDEHRTEAGDGLTMHMGPESLNRDFEEREKNRKGKNILIELA